MKTAVFRQIEKIRSENKKLPIEDIAASFENVVAEVLVERSLQCALDQGLNSLVLVGGVAANVRLREMMLEKHLKMQLILLLHQWNFVLIMRQ